MEIYWRGVKYKEGPKPKDRAHHIGSRAALNTEWIVSYVCINILRRERASEQHTAWLWGRCMKGTCILATRVRRVMLMTQQHYCILSLARGPFNWFPKSTWFTTMITKIENIWFPPKNACTGHGTYVCLIYGSNILLVLHEKCGSWNWNCHLWSIHLGWVHAVYRPSD